MDIFFLVYLEIYIFPDILEIGNPNLRILLYIPFLSFAHLDYAPSDYAPYAPQGA